MTMRKLWYVPVAFTLLFVLSGIACAKWTSDGLKTEDRDVSGFSEVVVGFAGKVILEQGDTEGLTIEADSDVIDEIVTEVRGRRLVIEYKTKNWGWGGWNRGNERATITVRFKNLSAVTLSGSANLTCKTLKSDDLDLTVSGSGDMWFGEISASWIESGISGSGTITADNVTAERVRGRISGSGDIEMSGTAGTIQLGISGSGSVDMSQLAVKEADVRISGSGGIRVNVSDELTGTVSGSGNVWYKGRPIVDVSTPGSGDVRHVRG